MNRIDALLHKLKSGMPTMITYTDINGERKSLCLAEFTLEYITTALVDDKAMVADSSVDEVIKQLRLVKSGSIYKGIADDLLERKKGGDADYART